MRNWTAYLVAVSLACVSEALAQVIVEMTPERVRAAIADKRARACYELRRDYACFTTPYSRVAHAARETRKKYEAFTETDVAAEVLAPTVEVIAWPQPSFIFGRGRVGPPIDVQAIVVMPAKSKDRSAAILPTTRVVTDARYQTLLGASYSANGMVATFPLSVLSEDNEVRVVYAGKGCADWKNQLTTECAFRFKLKDVK